MSVLKYKIHNRKMVLTEENHACTFDCTCEVASRANHVLSTLDYVQLGDILRYAGVIPHSEGGERRKQICIVLTK